METPINQLGRSPPGSRGNRPATYAGAVYHQLEGPPSHCQVSLSSSCQAEGACTDCGMHQYASSCIHVKIPVFRSQHQQMQSARRPEDSALGSARTAESPMLAVWHVRPVLKILTQELKIALTALLWHFDFRVRRLIACNATSLSHGAWSEATKNLSHGTSFEALMHAHHAFRYFWSASAAR